MTFMQRTARNFLLRKAVREVKGEFEKAGLKELKILANADISIISTYLKGCSPQKQAEIKRDFLVLQQMEITPEMVLERVISEIPGLASVVKRKQGYKERELQTLKEFVLDKKEK